MNDVRSTETSSRRPDDLDELFDTPLTRDLGIDVPIVCGAMYPCSNPELVAAASAAGGIGIVQPISMMFVHDWDLREGIRYIREQTDNPIGFNALVEQTSDVYMRRMKKWVDVALEEGVEFFISALGPPDWVVDKVHAQGGTVYHDVTNRKFAERAVEAGVDGFICVNDRAGGHAGESSPEVLFDELEDLGLPLVCAGGVGRPEEFVEALDIGYTGVQMGTRFIATPECRADLTYKDAICDATADDIVLTDKISGVPVSVIETDYIEETGTEAGWLAKRMLQHPKLKHLARSYYSLKSLVQLKTASLDGMDYREFWQAGKSVEYIDDIRTVDAVFDEFVSGARAMAAAVSDQALAG
ncbi:MAG: NAD(P)H-dependent flavin oxidoreductase [Bradymonadaceae bacterium]